MCWKFSKTEYDTSGKNMVRRYILALFFLVFFVAILSPDLPHEYSGTPVNFTDNETYLMPLMSSPDDLQQDTNDEKPGWWKHAGHSHVTYSTSNGMFTSPTDGNSNIAIRILLNGQKASDFPGPVFTTGSGLVISYEITNSGDLELADVHVADDEFGYVGECEILDAGESIIFKLETTVQEGNFSSVGRVSSFRESSLEVCSDQSPIYYFGKNEQEVIPEFPMFFVPVFVVLGLAFLFERPKV